MQEDIQQELDDLRQSLEKAKALHAWKELKESEQGPTYLPAFQMYDSRSKDLHAEVSYFAAKAVELRRRIFGIEEQWAIIARNILTAMEREMAVINLHL